MLRLVVYFLVVAGLAGVLSWLSDNRGSVVVNWQGYIWDTDVFQVTILLSILAATVILLWTALRGIWHSPAAIGNFFNRRREKRGLEALSSGMIAIGAGDRLLATRYAIQARKSLPNEPMTHLLRAQAAQLAGDRTTSRRIFEAMLAAPDTEALGLRGLFLEAEREGEQEAAKQFAERAVKLNPKLSWPVTALFDIQCRASDWNGALNTLAIAKKHGHVERPVADRRRAVLLAGQAQEAEDNDPERAMNLALEAHGLAVDLVPAAAVAGRLLAARGNTPRATKVLQKTWRKSPHPDLAVAYAHARLGDSPRDRLKRVQDLAALTPNIIESPIAVANAAIEAREFDAARAALAPLSEGRLTQRVCTLMARIEHEQSSNAGGVREWLARAVNAPRDPAWTADGVVSETWQPVSPVTGALDAFRWRVPVETAQPHSKEILAQKIEELVQLGVGSDAMIGGAGGVDDDRQALELKGPDETATSGGPKRGTAAVEVGAVGLATATATTTSPADRAASAGDQSPTVIEVTAEEPAAAKPASSPPVVASTADVRAADRPGPEREQEPEPEPEASGDSSDPQPDRSTPDGHPARRPDQPKQSGEQAAAAADRAAARSRGPGAKPSGAAEPQIFVSPRAPDDPGPEAGDAKPRRPVLPFQPAKG